MRIIIAALIATLLAACSFVPSADDPGSDAPDVRGAPGYLFKEVSSYGEALKLWRNAGDVNAWIGAKFQYNAARAMQLSETQRTMNARLPIISPEDFFSTPNGVCVDLARFAVETLRVVDPETKPAYVMIEFDPVYIGGNTLRRHWVVTFKQAGQHYFFADSKRPGHIAGPYASAQEFIYEYARYRARRIVSFRELESYERKVRTLATKRSREERP
ncbi:MAG: hypothetical protein IH606_13050 [Burkholderiales bacterium]|nr:hypothetical protein [Burkholderiales bacterium]